MGWLRFLGCCAPLLVSLAQAEINKVRLTTFSAGTTTQKIIQTINTRLQTNFTLMDFKLIEKLSLASLNFEMYAQVRAEKSIEGARLRIWKNKVNQVIAVEAHLEKPTPGAGFGITNKSVERFLQTNYLTNQANLAQQKLAVQNAIQDHHDPKVTNWQHEDLWRESAFVRVFKGVGLRGVHEVVWSHLKAQVTTQAYREHHQAELAPVSALGYKIYEQNWFDSNSALMTPETLTLKYLNDQVHAMKEDPFEALTQGFYLVNNYNPTLVPGEAGESLGQWNEQVINQRVAQGMKQLVTTENGFTTPQGLVLDGRYVAVHVHPGITKLALQTELPWRYSGVIQQLPRMSLNGMGFMFKTAYVGRTFMSPEDLLAPPVRHPQHDVKTYLEEGKDQQQVYWAVTEMMEKLQGFGFTDPEISKRKFIAYLYNPDPFFQNNAFYLNDTINFTTYTPEHANFARDNTTIWHEIGHGIIDRLGGSLSLIKGEGFHEGLADFLAELVLQATSFDRDFAGRNRQRIYNATLFNFANEAHDDGEAFGGLMKDVLDEAIRLWGYNGVIMMADLTLEAIRLTRGHPALDEREWVEKVLFADSRMNLKRSAGEFRPLFEKHLAKRNFDQQGVGLASMELRLNEELIIRGGAGGRSQAIKKPRFKEDRFKLTVRLIDGEKYQFQYPLTVKVSPGLGAQGPIDWLEEDLGPKLVTLSSARDQVEINWGTTGQCDRFNVGMTCSEPIYIEVFQGQETRPIVRQRVYLELAAFP